MSSGENFVCIASWRDAIVALEKSNGREVANELARQILDYGITGEFTTDDPLIIGLMNAMCVPIIDKSKRRYSACMANGRQGGRPTKYDPEAIRTLRARGLSHQQIAEQLGCSKKTVQRALNEEDEDEI